MGFAAVTVGGAVVVAQPAPDPFAAPQISAEEAAAILASPGRPGADRKLSLPVDTGQYRSAIVRLGEGVRPGIYYEPKGAHAGVNARVAVLYSDRNFGFDPPAAELARRGYRALYVSYPPMKPGDFGKPFDGFAETSAGIAFLRRLPGVERVVVIGWGAGASSMTLYASVAAGGPAACQGKRVIAPCSAAEATGLARADGLIMLDPGAGTRVASIDPAVGADGRDGGLDRFAAANGYDPATGQAAYPPAFRARYFAAQARRNAAIMDQALARRRALDAAGGGNEPFFVAGGANVPGIGSLSASDVSLLAHTKRPHLLLRADGTRAPTVLRSLRAAAGPKGDAAIRATNERQGRPASAAYSLDEFLMNDAVRATPAFALTADDIRGIDWGSSLASAPGQAPRVKVPSLIVSNTCFQFVVPAEIVFDRLAARDRTLVGVEGSEHEFGPCAPQYGDTKGRLFDYVAEWLGKPGRF
ncbi:hypothetical protein H7F51_02340 [Novosphingobium flavum]|uniref:Alpha/beta hydrolase n=1 Tax=Novosphingobium flavum TaxID=1778672 RepID=A0A7X1FP36_9SPHN|nr:hypothetical protein [Novosphingobium flavum]MBC2664351.1 hypothetical protein [Novosphingobium flavum]